VKKIRLANKEKNKFYTKIASENIANVDSGFTTYWILSDDQGKLIKHTLTDVLKNFIYVDEDEPIDLEKFYEGLTRVLIIESTDGTLRVEKESHAILDKEERTIATIQGRFLEVELEDH